MAGKPVKMAGGLCGVCGDCNEATPPTTPAAWPVPHVHCIEPSPPTFKLLSQVRDKFTQAGAAAVRSHSLFLSLSRNIRCWFLHCLALTKQSIPNLCQAALDLSRASTRFAVLRIWD